MEDIDKKINGDQVFQDSIKDLSDDEKATKISDKRREIVDAEIADGKKHKQAFEDQRKRAEIAEAELKKHKPEDKTGEKKDDLSMSDMYILTQKSIPIEDVKDIQDFAKLKGISISDALKSPIITGILSEKAQIRKTAEATRTEGTRSTAKVDAGTIIADIKSKGESAIPEPGSKEAEDIFWARRGGKRSN